MHAVTHVFEMSVLLTPLIEVHKVNFLIQGSCLAAAVGFIVGNDLATVGVNKLASLQILCTAKSW